MDPALYIYMCIYIYIYIYTHTYISILPLTPLPFSLPYIIEQSSFCLYSRSLLVIYFIYTSVYMLVSRKHF